jgi:hypothetical protein
MEPSGRNRWQQVARHQRITFLGHRGDGVELRGDQLARAGNRPLTGAACRCDREELLDRERFALEVVDHASRVTESIPIGTDT